MVENHVRALASSPHVDRILLVSGRRVGGLSVETRNLAEQVSLSGFDYDNEAVAIGSAVERSIDLAQRLESEFAAAGLHPDRTVLHWHNHSLGKNTAAPAVVRRLASNRWRQLLQIHDFAEDNRPDNYRHLITAASPSDRAQLDGFLYPVASQIHYATLTQGDAEVLAKLGIPSDQTHRLPNSVVLPAESPRPSREESLKLVRRLMGLPDDARWCLYPVRGIRRKNVGEFLLLCRWLPENSFGGLTLCPTTEVEKRSYQRWQQVAASVSPRAVFDAARNSEVSLADNLSASDFAFSTSVAEGFGMAFLEPWLATRGVVARRLPTVTDDFESAGLRLNSFYSSIPIPGDVAWLDACRDEIKDAFTAAWSTVPKNFRPTLQGGLPSDGQSSDVIDFARLTPPRQTEVLHAAADSLQYESELTKRSSRLVDLLHHPPDDDTIHHNASVVENHFSSDTQRAQLEQIYRDLLEADIDLDPDTPSAAGTAIDLVAQARPFYPCRTERFSDE